MNGYLQHIDPNLLTESHCHAFIVCGRSDSIAVVSVEKKGMTAVLTPEGHDVTDEARNTCYLQ